MENSDQYLTVTALTKYIKRKFDVDPYLGRIYLTGELSNFRLRPNAHQYFSLKDDHAKISAIMFKSAFEKVKFTPEEGMKVLVTGRISLYEASGSYQIYVDSMQPDGIGALYQAYEQLKKKLTDEGLFDLPKKRLPMFPKRIAVVTSPSGAVIRDIITTVSRRFPGVEILLFPTKVQGEGASQEVAANIAKANERDDLDLLIIGRGGGSIEDLWAFNEEIVVQAIFESRLPVISSVGHETDTTLADYVADRRAATPTAAAELATPVTKADIISWIAERDNRIYQAALRRIKQSQERLDKLANSVIFRQPERLYDGYVQKLDRLVMSLINTMQNQFSQAKQRQELLHQRLLALDFDSQIKHYKDNLQSLRRLLLSNMTSQYDSKLARFEKAQDALLSLDTSRIIARGYAMVQKDDKVISSVTDVNLGDKLTVQLKDGQLEVEVKDAK